MLNLTQARAKCRNPKAIEDRDRYIIIDRRDGSVLEGWPTECQAYAAAGWVNDHEEQNGRGRLSYTVARLEEEIR